MPGTSVFFTVKLGTGFVTVDVQWFGGDARACGDGGRVLDVGGVGGRHVAVKVTFTEWPAARVTWMVIWVVPVTVAEQMSVVAIVVHFMQLSGSGSRRGCQ